jgi:3-oxosteroid 1-dehydrogenase
VAEPAEHCDVLCLGSGAGGLAAAITAGDAGARVAVVEKAAKLGGSTAYSGGQIWAGPTHLAAAAGIADSAADVSRYLEFLGEDTAEPELREGFVAHAAEAVRFICEMGVPLAVVEGLPDYFYPDAPGSKAEGRIHEVEPFDQRRLGELAERVADSPYGTGSVTSRDRVECGGQAPNPEIAARRRGHAERGERCAGPGLAAALVKAADERGAAFHTSTSAVRLVSDGERVVGAVVRDADGERTIKAARGVVLATGGYDWNAALLKDLEQMVGIRSMAPPTMEGDHLALAADLGARIAVPRPPHASGVAFGFHTPGESVDGRDAYRYFTPGLPHSMIVNAAGRRFADDSFHPDLIAAMSREDGMRDGPVNWPAWLIVDAAYREKYPLGAVPPGAELPDGMGVSAPSVAGLAEAIGVDPDALVAEVERFNSFCAAGHDADFRRGSLPYTRLLNGDARMANPNLGPLERPPYLAIELIRVGFNLPAGGLATDAAGAVRSVRGERIPGLFAAGNAAAQLDVGAGYNSGIGIQRGLMYGYLAAREMLDA